LLSLRSKAQMRSFQESVEDLDGHLANARAQRGEL
jgi:hypothetical protein